MGLFDNASLFCGSRDLIDTLQKGKETTFCTISGKHHGNASSVANGNYCGGIAGLVFTYSLQQICIWGALHAAFIYWGMRYPFSYRMFKISGRIRYVHVISVILAVVAPLPGALIHLKDGYIITANPSVICAGRNTDYTYYTFILPLSVVLAITMCLLVLIFWTVLKVSGFWGIAADVYSNKLF